MKLKDIKPASHLQILMVGETGTGKTEALASFPELYHMDLDGRVGHLPLQYPDREDIDSTYFGPGSFVNIQAKIESFKRSMNYKTVSVDGLTRLTDYTISYAMGLRGKSSNDKGIIAVTEPSDYSAEMFGVIQLVDTMKSLPCNIILTAHELSWVENNMMAKKEEDKQVTKRKLVSYGNKVTPKVLSLFNEIWYFRRVDTCKPIEYKMYTTPYGNGLARTSLPLPEEIDLSGHKKLYPIIVEALKKHNILI